MPVTIGLTVTTVSGVFRRSASFRAQSRALRECSEPSTPTMMPGICSPLSCGLPGPGPFASRVAVPRGRGRDTLPPGPGTSGTGPPAPDAGPGRPSARRITLYWEDLHIRAPGPSGGGPGRLGPRSVSPVDEAGNGTKIRVFLLDDHEIVRRGVRDLIDAE